MLQEKINIWGHTLGLRFSALVPKIYYDNFEESFLEQIEKSILKVGMIQEKYKKFEADNDIYKFPTFDKWLNKFNKPNLFDFNWFVDLVIRLEENYTDDQEEEEEENSKKKLKKKSID